MLEELKLVLEMVGNVSDGAMWVAIIWVGQEYFGYLVGCTIGLAFITVSYKMGNRLINSCSNAAGICKIMGYNPDRMSGVDWMKLQRYICDIDAFYKQYKDKV